MMSDVNQSNSTLQKQGNPEISCDRFQQCNKYFTFVITCSTFTYGLAPLKILKTLRPPAGCLIAAGSVLLTRCRNPLCFSRADWVLPWRMLSEHNINHVVGNRLTSIQSWAYDTWSRFNFRILMAIWYHGQIVADLLMNAFAIDDKVTDEVQRNKMDFDKNQLNVTLSFVHSKLISFKGVSNIVIYLKTKLEMA